MTPIVIQGPTALPNAPDNETARIAPDSGHRAPDTATRIAAADLAHSIEALEFLMRRFERDRQLMTHLACAPDSAAAMAVLTAFFQRSLSDYGAEAARLSSLVTAAAQRVDDRLHPDIISLKGSPSRH